MSQALVKERKFITIPENAEIPDKHVDVLNKFPKYEIEVVSSEQVSFGARGEVFDLAQPSVYRIKGQDTLILFGEVKRSMSFEKIKELLAQYRKNPIENADNEVNEEEAENDNQHESMNATSDVNEKDVELLISETKCTKEEAVKALTENNMDVVEAMIQLQK